MHYLKVGKKTGFSKGKETAFLNHRFYRISSIKQIFPSKMHPFLNPPANIWKLLFFPSSDISK